MPETRNPEPVSAPLPATINQNPRSGPGHRLPRASPIRTGSVSDRLNSSRKRERPVPRSGQIVTASRQRDHGEFARFGECDFEHRAALPNTTANRAARPLETASHQTSKFRQPTLLQSLTSTSALGRDPISESPSVQSHECARATWRSQPRPH
jgi:hypothetical protein